MRPSLPGWLFDEQGILSFRFLGSCTVTYHNPSRADTYLPAVQPKRVVIDQDGKRPLEISGGVIGEPYASEIRAGKIKHLDVYF